MRSNLSTAALVAVAVAGAVFLTGTRATSQTAPMTMRAAFVDLAEIVRKYDKSAQIDRELAAERQRLLAEFQKQADELKRMQADIDILVAGTPEYREKEREIAQAQFMLEYSKKSKENEIRQKAMRKMLLVYTEIKNEAATYARANGLEAVFTVNKGEIEARAPEELPALIALRPVLYWDKSLDITEEILEILNDQLDGPKKPGNEPPGGPSKPK